MASIKYQENGEIKDLTLKIGDTLPTGTEVDKFALYEINATEYKDLAKLVGEYYQPEFDKISEGDVRASLERTRRLVAEWN